MPCKDWSACANQCLLCPIGHFGIFATNRVLCEDFDQPTQISVFTINLKTLCNLDSQQSVLQRLWPVYADQCLHYQPEDTLQSWLPTECPAKTLTSLRRSVSSLSTWRHFAILTPNRESCEDFDQSTQISVFTINLKTLCNLDSQQSVLRRLWPVYADQCLHYQPEDTLESRLPTKCPVKTLISLGCPTGHFEILATKRETCKDFDQPFSVFALSLKTVWNLDS